MGWQRSVSSKSCHVSFGNVTSFCRALFQKRPHNLSSILIVTTPSCKQIPLSEPRPLRVNLLHNSLFIYVGLFCRSLFMYVGLFCRSVCTYAGLFYKSSLFVLRQSDIFNRRAFAIGVTVGLLRGNG